MKKNKTKKQLDFSRTYIMLTNGKEGQYYNATLFALSQIVSFFFETVDNTNNLIMTEIHRFDKMISLDGHLVPIVDLAAASLDEFLLKAAINNLLHTI